MTEIEYNANNRPDPQEIRGFLHYASWLTPDEQARILADLREIVAHAPLFSPVLSSGKVMSVRMTSAGRFGWIADRNGYRYSPVHPSGTPWPEIPASIQKIWEAILPEARPPESCLINFYSENAKMGLHQDRDEADFSQPVLSISLGDDGRFRIGSSTRGGSTQSLWLRSGDVMVMGDEARLCYHGIDKIAAGTSPLMRNGGRVNITLRVVT
jgi:alkylated DNA repair protein (DNA oxidative demethylase)